MLHSQSIADFSEDEADLDWNEDFDQRKEKESLESRKHFQTSSHSLGGLRRKFNSQVRLLKDILHRVKHSPEIDRSMMLHQEFLRLSE